MTISTKKQYLYCFFVIIYIGDIMQEQVFIIVGNEHYDINENWYNNSHNKLYIPLLGYMNSLNVGVSASILMYQVSKGDK